MGIFDPKSKFDAIAHVLEQSRWFDDRWMRLIPKQGYPELGCFGLRSGPAFAAYAFYHDLAHAMIAVQDNELWRLETCGFGLDYTTQVEVFNQIYREPVTDQGTQLELRVIALQYQLTYLDTVNDPVLEIESADAFFKWNVESLEHLADFFLAQLKLQKDGRIDEKDSYSDRKKKAFEIFIAQCQEMASQWSEEAVVDLWEKTCEASMSLLDEQKEQHPMENTRVS